MDEAAHGPKRTLSPFVRQSLVCLALVAVGVGAVWAVGELVELGVPRVDLSRGTAEGAGRADDPENSEQRLRFAVATMVSAEATFSTYRRLVQRISRAVGRRGAFVLRPSYADVRRELEQGSVDVAFVCTGTYAHAFGDGRIQLLVQPQFTGGRRYRSQLIVPVSSSVEEWDDLRGAAMAFTDPESNTGCVVPSAELLRRGVAPRSFFGKVVFTGNHDRSIRAVALGAVDAACVDSLVLASNLRQDPGLASEVNVIWESEPFGPPPVVVPRSLDESLERSLRQAFLTLADDAEGREILAGIGVRRFLAPKQEDYRSAVELYERLHELGDSPWH